MRYDIMTKNKEKKGLRRGMENGGKKNDFFVTSAKLHIPLSWKFSLFEFLTRVHTTEDRMAIPRRISFLEESRSQGMTNLHSSGIEEYVIYSSGSSGNFEE